MQLSDGFIDRTASVAPSREAYKKTRAEMVHSLRHMLWTDSHYLLCVVYFSFIEHFILNISTTTKSYYSAIVTAIF